MNTTNFAQPLTCWDFDVNIDVCSVRPFNPLNEGTKIEIWLLKKLSNNYRHI